MKTFQFISLILLFCIVKGDNTTEHVKSTTKHKKGCGKYNKLHNTLYGTL